MRVCAVICEYNPFHLGHAYHLRAAREASGADYVLCLMSGALTQRGAFARHDKWLRARAALENGADLVLELPTRFACAPAPDFASGGVALGLKDFWQRAPVQLDVRNAATPVAEVSSRSTRLMSATSRSCSPSPQRAWTCPAAVIFQATTLYILTPLSPFLRTQATSRLR